jgi:hypothetical protein
MTPSQEPTLNILDVPKLISKYWPSMIVATIVSTALFIIAANHMPKKYKAHFILTIYSKYFQSPLVGDFVPELSESGEMTSQRESLIRQVLTPDYLDALGKKYGLYDSGQDAQAGTSWSDNLVLRLRAIGQSLDLLQPPDRNSQISAERESLRSRIEIYPLNSSTFNVGFIYSDPAVTLHVTQDLYGEIIQSLLEIRKNILGNIHDAIQNRLASMSTNIAPATPAPIAPIVPTGMEMVEEELASVRSQIQSLSSEYTDEHPLVIQLRDRERILVSRLAGLASEDSGGQTSRHVKAPTGEASGETSRDLYGDLSKKLNYINIAIDSDRQHQNDYFAVLETPLYPSAPLRPKKGLFALWGMALGLFGSLFIAAIREYFERSTLHASNLAQHLNIPLLGELPAFPSKTSAHTSTSAPY